MNHRITLLCGIACCASAASAGSITIANADFELPATPPGTTMPNAAFWTVNLGGVWNPIPTGPPFGDFNPGAGYGGNQVGFVVNGGNMSQVVSAAVMPNTTYTLSTLLGHQLNPTGTTPLGTGAMELWAGGTDVLDVNLDPSTVASGMFEQRSGSWTSTAVFVGDPIMVRYQSLSGSYLVFDNAGLVSAAAVPEPFTMALCAAGLGLALARRRGRK